MLELDEKRKAEFVQVALSLLVVLHDLHDVFEREPVNNHDRIGADIREVSEVAFQRVVSPDYLVLPQLSFVRSLRLRGLLAAFSSDDVV